jgi:hypothetical protein
MKKSLQEQILESGIIKSNIFALPYEEQNQYLKNIILDYKLIRPIITYKFVDANNITSSIYFPHTTLELKKMYNKKIIRGLDIIYELLLRRRFIITLEVVTQKLKDLLFEQQVMPDALLAMFFEEYTILPEQIKNDLKPINPYEWAKKELN